jgi:putative transposase
MSKIDKLFRPLKSVMASPVIVMSSALRFDLLPERRESRMYQVRRVNIGKTAQLDELARACGELYSRTLVSYWRTVRQKGLWLQPKHLMRWHTSANLHAHTADACVQAFFASLKSWRERRKADPTAKPPRRRKWYFRIEYKRSAMVLKDGQLRLSNGKGNDPLVLAWPWDLPQTVVIHWTGTQYEAIATYKQAQPDVHPLGEKSAGIDLGEVHMAVSHDGEHTHILNGRLLRSKRQYQNKLKAKLDRKIAAKKKGSRRRKKVFRSKQKQCQKIKQQIKDIEHKQTTHLISTLHREGVQTVVIGDVRDIRQDLDVGSTNNQKLHQWSHGRTRHLLTYKAERRGMDVALQEEKYTSRTCPACGHRKKSSVKGRNYVCGKCGARLHRDAVGARNIWYKYRGEFGVPHVVAEMAPATGIRFAPHTRVARL